MGKYDLLGKTEQEWYKIYEAFIDGVPVGNIDTKTGEIHLISYERGADVYWDYKHGKDEGDSELKVFYNPPVSVCEEYLYQSRNENRFEFAERMYKTSKEDRLKLIQESVKHRGDYNWKHDMYVKFLETLEAAINGRKVERTDYDYSASRDYWIDSNASDLICNGMYSNHFRIGHEFFKK